MITPEISDFFSQRGLPIVIGTRDRHNQPAVSRAFAVRIDSEGKNITAIVPDIFLSNNIENLLENGRIALTISDPYTHKTYQLKGRYASHSPADADDQILLGENFMAFAEFIEKTYGEEMKQALFQIPVATYTSITFTPEEIFDQTPGPDAGKKI